MKKCACCNTEKPFTEFRINKSKKDGFQAYCKDCDKEKQRDWYSKNKNKVKSKSLKSKIRRRKLTREFIIKYLKDNPCTECGEDDIIVLEFDHIHRENKKYAISILISNGSLEILKKEIIKCKVLCANCHKRKTAKESKWYKSI